MVIMASGIVHRRTHDDHEGVSQDGGHTLAFRFKGDAALVYSVIVIYPATPLGE